MSEERKAVVHEDEIAAMRDSRVRDLPLFAMPVEAETKQPDDTLLWVVAVSEHQALAALVKYVYPIRKLSKKERDDRYIVLLDKAMTDSLEKKKSDEDTGDAFLDAVNGDKNAD